MLGNPDNNSSAPVVGSQVKKEDRNYFAPPLAISLPKDSGGD
jgi:hypothetical protein